LLSCNFLIDLQVFTYAAADDTKSTVLLAFETVEKIVRDYFHHITETETTTFTDCVTCLIAFTRSQFSSDANLNAIAFLRFCAVKLAEEGSICQDSGAEQLRNSDLSDGKAILHKDDHVSLWVPLLAGQHSCPAPRKKYLVYFINNSSCCMIT
jgi:brefeldin A-inhibited guanine nucleotide-exchange protein